MTKQEYMEQLARALSCFSEDTQNEVLEDYESHFASALENGKTEEEVCLELGSIDDFIKELSSMENVKASDDVNIQPFYSAAQDDTRYHSKSGKKLILDGLIAGVSFRPSNDEQFHIRYENHGSPRQQLLYRFYFREEGDTIYTGVRKSKTSVTFWQTFNNIRIELNVEIPKKMNSISAKTSCGDISFHDISIPDVQLSTSSGDINCKNNTIDSLYINSASGDINCNSNITKSLFLNTASGDINCTNETAASFSSNSASGDIECKNIIAEKVKANSASGDVKLEGTFASCKADAVSGDVKILSKACSSVALNSVSGDVNLNAPLGADGHIHTVSGDISLSFNGCTAGFDISFEALSGICNIYRNGINQTITRNGHVVIPGDKIYTIKLSSLSGKAEIR